MYGYVVNDPVNWVDPSGNFFWAPALIGGSIGGLTGVIAGYYTSGATVGSIIRSGLIGTAAGALSAYGIGGILGGVAIGFGANVANQVASGKSLQCADYVSATISGAAGGLGTYVGGVAAGRFQVTFPVLGKPLSVIGESGAKSNGIISSSIGGAVGGIGDAVGNGVYDGQ